MASQVLTSQQRIWQTILLIPKGNVANYGLIADLAGLPKRARLVGTSLRQAPESMQLPWFRVVKSDGSIAFAAGSPEAKRQRELLIEDGVFVKHYRVKLNDYLWQPDLPTLLYQLKF